MLFDFLKITQWSNKNEKSVSFFCFIHILTLFVKICFLQIKTTTDYLNCLTNSFFNKLIYPKF